MTEPLATAERAILVGTPQDRAEADRDRAGLLELGRLADTAGAVVIDEVVQRLRTPDPRYYLGRGKAAELAERVQAGNADLVIFDDELTPAQGRSLEAKCGVRILDRTELILDIFATRARTREARMQVELAQLQYLLPRLRRMWVHLSRIRGGIGLRGPGETQLETDRRLIATRIVELRRKLAAATRARAVQRKGRSRSFRVALVGYTNAGKSSLLQALSGSDQFVEDRLFATLDSATRLVPLDEGFELLATDTVGFIRNLPHHLVASFRSTLEEAAEADLLMHVVDAAHPDRARHESVVESVLAESGLADRPEIRIYNKIDLLDADDLLALRREAAALERSPILVSTIVPATLHPLKGELLRRLRAEWRSIVVHLPVSEGKALATLHAEGEVLACERSGYTLCVSARAPETLIGRLARLAGIEISETDATAHSKHPS